MHRLIKITDRTQDVKIHKYFVPNNPEAVTRSQRRERAFSTPTTRNSFGLLPLNVLVFAKALIF